jgi:hypothetical protein
MKKRTWEAEVTVDSVLCVLQGPVWIKEKQNQKDVKDNQQGTIISSVILPVFSSAVTKNNYDCNSAE